MSSMQITASQHCIYPKTTLCIASKSKHSSSRAGQFGCASINPSANSPSFKQGLALLKYKQPKVALKHQCTKTVCLFGSKGKDSGDGGSPWNAFDKVLENFKKGESVEDALRRQIEKGEFFKGGDGGKTPPGSGGGGGGGGSSSGSEDDGLAGIMDETLQVILATIGFIFLYIYIISGEELTRLAKDYIKYVFGGSKSVRLRRAMYQWGRFYQRLTEKKQYDEYWLEKAILNTPTWWDHPDKYRRAVLNYLEYLYEGEPSASSNTIGQLDASNSDGEDDASNSDDDEF